MTDKVYMAAKNVAIQKPQTPRRVADDDLISTTVHSGNHKRLGEGDSGFAVGFEDRSRARVDEVNLPRIRLVEPDGRIGK